MITLVDLNAPETFWLTGTLSATSFKSDCADKLTENKILHKKIELVIFVIVIKLVVKFILQALPDIPELK